MVIPIGKQKIANLWILVAHLLFLSMLKFHSLSLSLSLPLSLLSFLGGWGWGVAILLL